MSPTGQPASCQGKVRLEQSNINLEGWALLHPSPRPNPMEPDCHWVFTWRTGSRAGSCHQTPQDAWEPPPFARLQKAQLYLGCSGCCSHPLPSFPLHRAELMVPALTHTGCWWLGSKHLSPTPRGARSHQPPPRTPQQHPIPMTSSNGVHPWVPAPAPQSWAGQHPGVLRAPCAVSNSSGGRAKLPPLPPPTPPWEACAFPPFPIPSLAAPSKHACTCLQRLHTCANRRDMQTLHPCANGHKGASIAQLCKNAIRAAIAHVCKHCTRSPACLTVLFLATILSNFLAIRTSSSAGPMLAACNVPGFGGCRSELQLVAVVWVRGGRSRHGAGARSGARRGKGEKRRKESKGGKQKGGVAVPASYKLLPGKRNSTGQG